MPDEVCNGQQTVNGGGLAWAGGCLMKCLITPSLVSQRRRVGLGGRTPMRGLAPPEHRCTASPFRHGGATALAAGHLVHRCERLGPSSSPHSGHSPRRRPTTPSGRPPAARLFTPQSCEERLPLTTRSRPPGTPGRVRAKERPPPLASASPSHASAAKARSVFAPLLLHMPTPKSTHPSSEAGGTHSPVS